MLKNNNFVDVTELSGDDVSSEQVNRLCNRYYWAGTYCVGKDVLEIACGTGQGLGYLLNLAKSLSAGDYSTDILNIVRAHYGNRIPLQQFDAQSLPYPDNSKDIIILFEALYYLPFAERFVRECRRVLRNGGRVLVATANKDLFDFNPSPHSYKYYGVVELNDIFGKEGFSVECFGNASVDSLTWNQRILRLIKKIAVSLNLIPKTMKAKKILKRLVFGKLTKLPSEIKAGMKPYIEPKRLPLDQPDRRHKVIYCSAILHKK